MSPRGDNDALCDIHEFPALEHTEVLEASRDLLFRYTGERLCNFGAGQTTVSTTFGRKSLFVDKLGFKPSGKCVTVKNGDASTQLSMGSVKVTMSIG